MRNIILSAVWVATCACGHPSKSTPRPKPAEPSVSVDAGANQQAGEHSADTDPTRIEETPADVRARWRQCESDRECIVIPSYCGGWASVNRSYAAEAREFYDRIGAIKDCRQGTARRPTPHCSNNLCEPANVWNDGQ